MDISSFPRIKMIKNRIQPTPNLKGSSLKLFQTSLAQSLTPIFVIIVTKAIKHIQSILIKISKALPLNTKLTSLEFEAPEK